MKALRKFAALSVALTVTLLPLLVVTAAWASPLDDAQANLYAGQQELVNATLDKHDADALVASASQDVTDAQTALAAAQAAYDATRIDYPAVTTTGSVQNVVQNGDFNDASAWSSIGMGSDYTMTNSSIARVYNGVLIGSYTYGNYVKQTGTFATPTRHVVFSYDMSNNNFNNGQRLQADGYRVEFRTYSASGQRLNYYNTGDRSDTFGWTHFTATYDLPVDAVTWDIGFRLGDNGYWNGNYAGSIDNVSLLTATSVTVPAHTTYGVVETAALVEAQTALASARTSYANALVLQQSAASRLQAAIDAIPSLEAAVLAATPVVVPQPIDTATPLPTETPQTPEPTATPTTTPDPVPSTTTEPSPEPQPSQPEPVVTPTVEPSPSPAPVPEPVVPVVPPVVEPPVVVPVPQPQPIPFPVVTPDPVVPEPVVTPEPVVPTPEPVVTPEPAPVPVETPAPAPVPVETAPAPVPVVTPPVEPAPEPPVVAPEKDVSNIATVDLKSIDPQELTTAEVAQLVSAAVEVLATASEGSPQYEKALDALAVAAQADDPQVPEELANIPGVGAAAVAVLNAFNALGNFGADMSPAHRATAKKEVVAAIVLTQVTSAAIGAATSAASSPTSRKTK